MPASGMAEAAVPEADVPEPSFRNRSRPSLKLLGPDVLAPGMPEPDVPAPGMPDAEPPAPDIPELEAAEPALPDIDPPASAGHEPLTIVAIAGPAGGWSSTTWTFTPPATCVRVAVPVCESSLTAMLVLVPTQL